MTAVENEIAAALPDYIVEREIGRGGMGVVFLGRHARLDRRVAIKELPPSFAADPAVRERFGAEAKTLAALSHPHIVPVYDYVEREGLCLIVMEELPGGTVWERFTTVGLVPPVTCAIVVATCAALQRAHDHRVLHLDMKPDNLMFAREGTVKVTDFGISRVVSGDHTLGTVDGQVLGTPAYMSPEQAKGIELSPASDIFSTGVMLYELLSGHLPWSGADSATELLLKRLREPPTPLRSVAPHVPAGLADAVGKAIGREPENRFSSAEDFGVAIASACADAWGTNWLDETGVPIIGSDRLSIAARTTSARSHVSTPGDAVAGSSAPAAMTVTGESVVPADTDGRAAETTAAGAAPAAAGEVTSPPSMPQFEAVRAAGSEGRVEGADLNQLGRAAFVDVADLIKQPASPLIPVIVAIALLIAAVAAGLALFTAPSSSGTVKPGEVRLAGHDVTSGKQISLDTSAPIALVAARGTPAFADRAQLQFSIAGVPAGSTETRVANGKGKFEPSSLRYVVTGAVTANLTFSNKARELAHADFAAEITRPWYLTVQGIGSVLVILAGLAYFESSIRPFRKGRRRILSYVGCGISAAVSAAGAVVLAGAAGLVHPTVAGLIAVCSLTAIAGAFAGEATRRIALRRGVRRAVKRAEETLIAA